MVPGAGTRRELLAAALSAPAFRAVSDTETSTESTETGTGTAGSEWRMFLNGLAATGSLSSVAGPAASETVEQWSINPNYPTGPVFTDDRGATDTARTTVTVAASNQSPTASFTVAPEYPVPGTELTFDGTASTDPNGEIERYEWEVDDAGVTGTGLQLTHTFSETGEHSVVLRVTDSPETERDDD